MNTKFLNYSLIVPIFLIIKISDKKQICYLFRDEDAPEMVDDEDAVKPEGWLDDEPELTPDPEAEKPSDWSVPIPIIYMMCCTHLNNYHLG